MTLSEQHQCTAGTVSWPSCTPHYAPPEVACALWTSQHITAHPSHDIWSTGVLLYEAITQQRAMKSQTQIAQCAQNQELYPWEVDLRQQPRPWKQSRLRAVIEPCLRRDASARPSAEQLHAGVIRLGQCSTSNESMMPAQHGAPST